MPRKLLAFPPVNGANTPYDQFYRITSDDAYKAVGIDGFLPHNPFKGIKALFASIAPEMMAFPIPVIPTLVELNAGLTNWTEDKIQDALFPDEPVPSD